jgi:hypothetical protein
MVLCRASSFIYFDEPKPLLKMKNEQMPIGGGSLHTIILFPKKSG